MAEHDDVEQIWNEVFGDPDLGEPPFDPDEMRLPDSFGKGDLAPLRWMREQLAAGTADRGGPVKPFAVTAQEAKTIIALTYGMIAMIDDAVGDG